LLLIESRRPARTTADGSLVVLAEQDRSLWDRSLIDEGQALVRRCLRRQQPGPFQIQAAINAVHSDARTATDTQWDQIVQLYDQLMSFTPTPIVALNRAIAIAECAGAAQALSAIDSLQLADYQPFHAARAELLRRLGRNAEAIAAFDVAIAMSPNLAERRFLEHRRASISTD
jgi:RNA polymerase sigma-70 factor (ECF subfamily)